MINGTTILIAFVAGILPALFWLWFWLREDRLHPEPKRFIIISFVLGMLAVPLVIPFQHFASVWLVESSMVIFAWAMIEELAKFVAAYVGGLRQQAMNEPIDALIYLITPALGFAALENALFLIEPFGAGDIFLGVVTTNVRFLGATLVHTVASSVIGTAIAFSFYRKKDIQVIYVVAGVMGAIILHALFNFFILEAPTGGMFLIFLAIWISVVFVILIFEKVKQLQTPF